MLSAVDVYVKTIHIKIVFQLLHWLERTGFGKVRSTEQGIPPVPLISKDPA